MNKFEGIDPIAMGFEIDLQGKRYVTTEGLLYLMGDQYIKYSVRPELPTVEEVSQIRQMMGLEDTDALVVMRGVVETEKGTFVDYGTTTKKNLKGYVTFATYPLEMACRRATNRAMRMATGAGTSIDEIDTDVQPNQQETQAEVVDTKPAQNGQPKEEPQAEPEMVNTDVLQSLLDRTDALHRQKALTDKEAESMVNRLSGGLHVASVEGAEKFLTDKRNAFLSKRNEEEAEGRNAMTDLQFRHKYLHSGRAQGVRVRRTQAHIDDFATHLRTGE